MTKRQITRPEADAADRLSVQRERAKRLRDAAGRFSARTSKPASDPQAGTGSLGTVSVPANSHPDTYGLQVDEGGLGLHAPPGASVIVEPVIPTKAGLAVFYLKERPGPVIFDLTHDFRPELVQPFAPGSEVVPMVDLCEPGTGIRRWLRADRIEKLHRVTGIHTPVEIAEKHRPAPTPLPVMTEPPEGMGDHFCDDTAAYPLVRPGEAAVYDPAQREPTTGALCLLQWNSGGRSILLTNLRKFGGQGEPAWFVDPVNRPSSREMMEQRLADNVPGDMLHTSDGPFTAEHLRSKIVGTVVGVLAPYGYREPVDEAPGTLPEAASHAAPDEARDEPDAAHLAEDEDKGDAKLIALGRQFVPAAARDLEACRRANEMDRQDEGAPPEVEAEFVSAAEAAQALAYSIADLPARTAAGIRTKLRALAHYNPALLSRTRLPEHADPDQALAFSLFQDLQRTATEDTEEAATAESIAPLQFEAVDLDTPLRAPKEWAALFAGHALGMHIADKTLRMGKAELVAFIRDAAARGEGVDKVMYEAMTASEQTLEGWSNILAAAGARYLVAAAAMVEGETQQPKTEA